jgi:hypothetical protein
MLKLYVQELSKHHNTISRSMLQQFQLTKMAALPLILICWTAHLFSRGYVSFLTRVLLQFFKLLVYYDLKRKINGIKPRGTT